jgi:hypothetical protein
MDWSRAGEALIELELQNLRTFRGGWPRFGWHYYAEVDEMLQRWASRMGEAGLASPLSLALGFVWLYGFGAARLPSPWRQFFAVSALLWALGALQGRGRTE